jgi:hypothetical protein
VGFSALLFLLTGDFPMSRLIKIRLADSPFWFFGDIKLTSNNLESNYLDFDSLSEVNQKIIINSANYLEVKLFDVENKRIKNIEEFNNYSFSDFKFDNEEEYEEDNLPEIKCITVSDVEKESNTPVLSEEDIENAKILLDNKFGVIKKTIETLSLSDKNLLLVQAMIYVEEDNKARKQIISCLEKKLMEFAA